MIEKVPKEICRKCGRLVSVTLMRNWPFNVGAHKDEPYWVCKECEARYFAGWYAKNREKYNKKRQRKHIRNRVKMLEQSRQTELRKMTEDYRAWREHNKETYTRNKKRTRLIGTKVYARHKDTINKKARINNRVRYSNIFKDYTRRTRKELQEDRRTQMDWNAQVEKLNKKTK